MGPKHILLVEDDRRSVVLVAHVFALPRYELRTASTAHAALAALEDLTPNLILLDLKLPDMHGLELLRRLRGNACTASIPVVAVTAYAMKGDAEQALAAGVAAYVTKPIDRSILSRVVDELLTSRNE